MNLRWPTPNLQEFRRVSFLEQEKRTFFNERGLRPTNNSLVVFFASFGAFLVVHDHAAQFLLVLPHFLPHLARLLDLESKKTFGGREIHVKTFELIWKEEKREE